MIVGLSLAAGCLINLTLGGIEANAIILLGLALMALGELFFCAPVLFPHEEKLHD